MSTNQRQRVREFPTPKIDDLVFYKTVSSRNGNVEPPAYGTKLTGQELTDFPDHKLSYVETDRDGDYVYYYAKDRENQDDYNWNYVQAGIGNQRFSAVQRSYVTSRSSYDPENLQMGSVMPDPGNKFSSTYVLTSRQQGQIDDKRLSSLYIVEQRTYTKKVTISRAIYDPTFGVPLKETSTLYHASEIYDSSPNPSVTMKQAAENHFATYFGKDSTANGDITTYDQLSENWYLVKVREGRDTAISNYIITYPTYSSITIPNVLKSVDIVYNTGAEKGTFESDWIGWAQGTSFSISGSEAGNASGGAFVQPEPLINIKKGFSGQVPTTVHVFYEKEANLTTRLATFGSNWPNFYPETHTLVLKGQNGSVTARASAAASRRWSSSTNAWDRTQGYGSSKNIRNSTSVVTLPATIHPDINIGGLASKTKTAEAEAHAGWPAEDAINFPVANAESNQSLDVIGSFSPTTLFETTPASVPTTGNYILSTRISPFEDGWVRAAVEVLDASDLGL